MTGHYLLEAVRPGQALVDDLILDRLADEDWLIDKRLIGEIVEEEAQGTAAEGVKTEGSAQSGYR